jgi:3',5'-cyclic AMP phosphodiesterase CpdA
MWIAQISDMHITRPGRRANGIVDSAGMLQDCVSTLAAMQPPPDLVVLTGDLVDSGHPDEYALLRTLLAPLRQRILLVPGNHDDRQALRSAFADQGWLPSTGFLQFVHDEGALHIVGLDTLLPGQAGGALCAQRLAWLDRALAQASARPTLLLMHHPPFVTGLHGMDAMGLSGRDEFAAVIARHPQVQLILCGHLHRNIQAMVGGCRVLTCPSPAHQVALDLRPEAPAAFSFCLEPPGFMLHRWTAQGFVSHAVLAGRYPGPFPF